MKRLIFLLTTLFSIFLLTVSGNAAETIDDLTRIHKNLNIYIYKPYFEKSVYFEEYEVQMDFVSKLLESDDITQEEIDEGYTSLKGVYANMMKDTYNYDQLPSLVEYYASLNSLIFTEESWKKLVSCTDEIKTELDSPAIYYREDNDTETTYRTKTQAYIDGFETKFLSTFNQLKFNEEFLDEEITKEELASYCSLLDTCVNDDLLKDEEGYAAFLTAMNYAQDTIGRQNPSAERILRSKTNLENAYTDLMNAYMDFSIVNDEIQRFKDLEKEDYESKSFSKYEEEIEKLTDALGVPHYFYNLKNCSEADFKKYTESYLKSITSVAKNTYNYLLPTSLVDELQDLCDHYRDLETMDGLELKLSLLKSAVHEGDQLLEKMSDTREKFEKSITAINEAYNNLKTAENHLIEEQAGIVKQDPKTVKMIIVFALLSLSLSVIFAVLVSKRQYGVVDWTK